MSQTIPADAIIKVLLVDDEVNITKALRRLLSECDNYEVFSVDSGVAGIAFLQETADVGVIISDQRMPGMTGVEFLARARELTPAAVRILLTGYADIEASIAAINQGAVFRYLTKPWQDEELLQVVAEAARNYWLVAENVRLNVLVAKQTVELQDWNARLKQRVLDQTAQIRSKSDALAESNQQLRGSFNSTIEALAGLIAMRDRRAPGHSRNVAALVSAMAARLELPQDEQERYRSAGLLHDIGKIALSDSLLAKSLQDCDEKERKTYQLHVIRGQAAIDTVPALREIGLLIRHHHERFDGHGFPDRLRGAAIPLGARLIGVADTFERLLIQSSEADALDAALEELTEHWGKALDPTLRIPFEEGAREVYRQLDISAEIIEVKVNPKELQIGMQLHHDLYSGTGVLMLKQGTVFDEAAIAAITRCLMIDPFERKISVLIDRSKMASQS